MKNLKPNEQRAKNAITLIWIVLALEVVSLTSGYFQYDLLQTVANGGEITEKTANANDTRERIIGILYSVTFLFSAITFIQWFRRAYFNLHLKVNNLKFAEGWAAGSWFVPVLNLYRPYQIMKELYTRTKELLPKEKLGFNSVLSTGFVSLWWALWIINSVIGQVLFRYTMNAESIDELTRSTIASMVGNLVGIPLALITLKVISDYSKVEPLLYETEDEIEAIGAMQS